MNNTKYYAIRNFEYMEAHEVLYVMLLMFILITISIIIISKIVAEYVLNPLTNIISQSKEINNHNIDAQLTKTRDDEIANVKQLFKKIKKDYELLNIERKILVKSNDNVNIFIDKNLISEVLRGLIDNSIKYSAGNIELIAKENETAEIIVRNYGEGIPEEEKKKLFNRNFQGKNAKKGAGLGLSIIKDIILLNDGEIYLENREDGLDVKMEFKKIEIEE